jgi:hypothetical protein
MTDGTPRFTRFRAGSGAMPAGYSTIPGNGMCLSTFLVLRAPDDPHRVLLGRIDPSAPWLEKGGLDPDRVAANATTWLLPACQWLLFETPPASVDRIARDFLDGSLPPLQGPRVVSETMARSTPESSDPHWDVNFLYEGTWPTPEPPRSKLFRELAFRDVRTLRRAEFGRHHDDLLDAVGLSPAD